MAFDSLDIQIGGSAADAKAAISSVKQSLSSADRAADGFGTSLSTTAEDAEDMAGESRSLAASLFGVSRAASSAEGNIDEVGRSSAAASGGMTTFALTTEGAGFSVRGLSGSIVLSLLPALATLTAALTPVVAALGGLAAIAGSIGLVGLVGVMGAVSTNTEELKERFTTLLETVTEAFQPVFDAATEVLLELMDVFAGVVSELVPSQDVIETIAENFEELGTVVIEALPAFADLAATLASEFLPPFVEFVEDILPDVPGLVRAMIRAVRRVLPMFMDFGRFLARFLPRLLDFGYTALPVVADALGTLGGAVNDVLGFVNRLGDDTGKLISQLSLVAPVVLGLANVLGGPVTAAIVGFGAAWATNFMDIRQTTRNVINRVTNILSSLATDARQVFNNIKGYISANQDDFNALRQAVQNAVRGVRNTFNNVLAPVARAVFENYLMPLIQEVAAVYARHYDDIAQETAETINAIAGYLRDFGKRVNTFWNNHGKEITNVVRGYWNGISTVITTVLDGIFTSIRVVMNLIQGDWEEAWSTIEAFVTRTVRGIQSWLQGPGKTAMQSANNIVTDAIQSAWDWLLGVGGWIRTQVEKTINGVVTWVQSIGKQDIHNAFEAVGGAIRDVWLRIFEIGGELWSDLKTFVSRVVTYVKSGQAWTDIKQAFDTLVSTISGVIDDAFKIGGEIWGVISGFVTDFATYIESGEAWKDIKQAFGALTDVIKAAFTGLADGLIGNSVIPDMISDIASYLRNAGKNALEDAAEFMIDAVESVFQAISFNIDWPEPPAIVKKAFNGNLNIDWPEPPNFINNGGDDSGDDGDDGGDGGGWVPPIPPIGGGPLVPGLASGGMIEQNGLAMLHAGEQVVPAAQVSDRGEVTLDASTIAEGVAQGFRRVDTDNGQPQEITIQLEDSDRYRTVRR